MDLIAKPAGQDQDFIAKLSADNRSVQIDCSRLLREYELIVKSLAVYGPGLALSNAWSRSGTILEVNVGGGQVPSNLPFKDFQAAVTLQTTQGTLQVAFTVRSFK